MSDREYVVLNTSIRTGSNSNQLLVNEDGDVQATIDLRLPDNIFTQNTGASKVANVEMQTSKMRLSMINTPVAELPLDMNQTNSTQVVSSAQLDVYPYSILDNGRIVPIPGNVLKTLSFPKYKEHLVTLQFELVNGWTADGLPITVPLSKVTVQANSLDSTFPESSRFATIVEKAKIMDKIDHMMNLCASSNHDFDVDGDKLYIKNIGTLEQMLQDAIENAITYASTNTETTLFIYLIPTTGEVARIPDTCPYKFAPDQNNTVKLREYDNREVCYWCTLTADEVVGMEAPDVDKWENSLKWAVKPRVKITDNGITITYDSASFDKVVPVLWNTGFVDTEDQPKQMTLDKMRNEAWWQPPPKRVYKYGVATSEETYTNSYDGDMKGYQFTLVNGTTCAPFNIIVNNAFKNTFSFLPWVEFNPTQYDFGKIMDDIEGTPDQDGMETIINKYDIVLKDSTKKQGTADEYIIFSNNGGDDTSVLDIVKHGQNFPGDIKLRQKMYYIEPISIGSSNYIELRYYYQLEDPTDPNHVYSNRRRQYIEERYSVVYQETSIMSSPYTYNHEGPEEINVESEHIIDRWSTIVPQPGVESGTEVIYSTGWTDENSDVVVNKGVVRYRQWYIQSIGEFQGQLLTEGTFENNVMISIPGWAADDISTFTRDGETWFVQTWQFRNPTASEGGDAVKVFELTSDAAGDVQIPMIVGYETVKEVNTLMSVTQDTTITQVEVKDYPDYYQSRYLYPNISNVPEDTILYKPIAGNSGSGFGFSGQSSYMADPENTFYILDGTSANISIGPQEVIEVGNGGFDVTEIVSIPTHQKETYDARYYWDRQTYTPAGRPSFKSIVGTARGERDTSGSGVNVIKVYAPTTLNQITQYVSSQNFVNTGDYDYWYPKGDGAYFISNTRVVETIEATETTNTYVSFDELQPGTTTTADDILLDEFKAPATVLATTPAYKIVSMNIRNPNDIYETKLVSLIFRTNSKNINGEDIWYPESGLSEIEDWSFAIESLGENMGVIYYVVPYVKQDGIGAYSLNYYESSGYVYPSQITRIKEQYTKTTTKTVAKSSNVEYSGNVALTFTWENIPMVVLSPIQSIVLTMTGVQLNQEIMPVNIANTTNVGSSLVSTIPVIQNFFSFAASMRDLHDELVITKENFDNTATYSVSTTGGQERSIQISAKYITKDGKVHQIYIPRYGVFTVQLIFGIDFYSTH